MVGREDNRERIQPVARGNEKTIPACRQEIQQQKHCACIDNGEWRTQKNAIGDATHRRSFVEKGFDLENERRMVSSRFRVIIAYQSELMHTAGVLFPQLHIRGAFGKENQVKANSSADSNRRPKRGHWLEKG